MMRKIFLIGTGFFWLLLIALALAAWLAQPSLVPTAPEPEKTQRFSLLEVARHSSADDCWMVINSTVYNFTAFLPDHPSKPSFILPWCGREASEAYQTKTRNRAHSPQADQALATFSIGFIE
jgi:cytochrome b involved in lipid metabolism